MTTSIIFLFTALSVVWSNECLLDSPVGVWLQNNPKTSCSTAIGHFVLDETVTLFTHRLFPTFGNLTRLEGCILATNFIGVRDFSFLENLKEIVCQEGDVQDEIVDVISVDNYRLDFFGWTSLVRVEGPGSIIMSFETMGGPYVDKPCFLEEEIRFLAFHPQYNSQMPNLYPPDPCFQEFSQISDIPSHCTMFINILDFTGIVTSKDFENLANLEVIVGEVRLTGTLFDDFDVLPNLKIIYSTQDGEPVPIGSQKITISTNPYMKNYSIPSLLNTRRLYFVYTENGNLNSKMTVELDPCPYMKQFSKGQCEFLSSSSQTRFDPSHRTLQESLYIVCLSISLISVLISFRAILVLSTTKHGAYLPSSRRLVAVIIFVAICVQIDKCIKYEREVQINKSNYASDQWMYYIPTVTNSNFLTPFGDFFSLACVAAKYACLVLIPWCYVDYAFFFRLRNPMSKKTSHWTAIITFALTFILACYFKTRLFIFARVARIEPEMIEQSRPVLYYYAFVLHEDGRASATLTGGFDVVKDIESGYRYDSESYNQFPNIEHLKKLVPDVLGYPFAEYANVVDMIFIAILLIFYLYKFSRFLVIGNSCSVLFFLYLQLSANRIRWFISEDFLRNGYCHRDYGRDVSWQCYELRPYKALVQTILDKLPHISFLIVSIMTYRFARFHLFLGHVLHLQACRKRHSITGSMSKGTTNSFVYASVTSSGTLFRSSKIQ